MKQKKQQTPVYNQIVVQPLVRTTNDVGAWRTAVRLFDSGNRSKLYDLYEDILIDGILSDAIDKRIDAVKDADLAFTVDNKDVNDIYAQIIDTAAFEELISEIMLARFWGISLDEFFFNPQGGWGFESIPRKHVLPLARQVKRREQDETGVSYDGDPNIIQWGKDRDMGLLFKIAPLVIYKRGGFGDWAQFVELFGMPLRIGKYSSMDENSRRELVRAFETAGSAPYLVIPKETEASQTVNTGNGNSALYNDFRKACTEEILISVLGQTMTTVDGSSLAQGQVHLAVQEKKHRADRRFVERMLNQYFLPLLEQRGYPVKGGKFKFIDAKKELEVTELIQLADIMPIPQSYLHEKYNIPLPRGDEPVARRQTFMQYEVDETKDDGAKEDVKNNDNVIAGLTRNPFQRLFDFFAPAHREWASEIRTLNNNAGAGLQPAPLSRNLIRQVVDEGGRAYFNAELFAFTANQLVAAVRKGYASNRTGLADMSFVYNATDEAYLTAMEQNLFHFSASKTLAEMAALNRLMKQSRGFQDFYKKAVETTNVFNKKWMETEYNTAVHVAESASTYRRLIAKKNIFPFWQYKTAGDDKVRDEHARLDGVILEVDDPRWQKIMPPNGWNCRCYIIPLLRSKANGVNIEAQQAKVDEFFTTKEWRTGQMQGFGINRAVEADIFTANQMYVSKFPSMAAKLMDKITPQEWGVNNSLKQLMKQAESEMPAYNGKWQDWFENYKTIVEGQDVLELKDYNGRTWTMSRADFAEHNRTAHRAGRYKYLNSLPDILAKPDEVWIGRQLPFQNRESLKLNSFVFVKYYKDVILVAAGAIDDNILTLKTWYNLEKTYVRRGMLIKKGR